MKLIEAILADHRSEIQDATSIACLLTSSMPSLTRAGQMLFSLFGGWMRFVGGSRPSCQVASKLDVTLYEIRRLTISDFRGSLSFKYIFLLH
ncbi:MAG: hypothetical protein WB586_09235 [Chthoniobacterales bacterium]